MTHSQAIGTRAPQRYTKRKMTNTERHEFEEHFFDCISCALEVKRLDEPKTSLDTVLAIIAYTVLLGILILAGASFYRFV